MKPSVLKGAILFLHSIYISTITHELLKLRIWSCYQGAIIYLTHSHQFLGVFANLLEFA